MARDKLITIRIEGEKREAFNQLAKSQNTDTASLLYDFISGCLDGKIDVGIVTEKKQRIDKIDTNRIDSRIDDIEMTTQRLDNWIGALSGRLNDWIEAFDDRLNDCDRGLSGKITSLDHRLNALSIQLDSQKDSQEMTTQKIDTDSQRIDTDSQQDSQRIDDMEYLLKRERECSIATSPIPSSSSPAIAGDEDDDDDDEDVTGEDADSVEPDSTVETEPGEDAIETQ